MPFASSPWQAAQLSMKTARAASMPASCGASRTILARLAIPPKGSEVDVEGVGLVDYGFVGDINTIDTQAVQAIVDQGMVPVISAAMLASTMVFSAAHPYQVP